MTADISTGTTGEIVKSTRVFSEDDLRGMTSFDDVFNRANELGLGVSEEPEIGTGFTKLDDKERLVKQRFVIVEWRFLSSDDFGEGGEYVAATLITAANEKFLITDGSTGICAQLKRITESRSRKARPGISPNAILAVPGGLRVSEYYYNGKTGEVQNKPQSGKDWTKAQTFYLAE